MLIYDYSHLTLSGFEWPLRQLCNQKGKVKGHGCGYGNHIGFCGTSYFLLRYFDWPSLSMSIKGRIFKEICGEEGDIKDRENNHGLFFFKLRFLCMYPFYFLILMKCIYFLTATKTVSYGEKWHCYYWMISYQYASGGLGIYNEIQ